MSHHPSYTMAVICAIGGIAAFSKARSKPSLIAGIGVGTLYGIAGYVIKNNKDYGNETALAASILLAGSMVPRAIKTKKPIPLSLGVLSIGVGAYYAKKIYEYRVGV
ncbi:transmembrane proteins 14C-domain-containing protein [Glomus cerebriforme]|uniref:Transmembrane proteins 14C-domain-containing protein n=1 Tax=Glomus cerebriforme TaxID=658196 RepID=A0A397TE30_9GLOM|nr:transmembrane proteins 14C-domain-containing protein [Glomus cerebriforme]